MGQEISCEECRRNVRSLKKYIVSLRTNLDNDRSVRANFMFLLRETALNPHEQTKTIEETERNTILTVRRQEFSIGDLAFIFERSKSTIHAVVKTYGDGENGNSIENES